MGYVLTPRDHERLKGVHPHLVQVVNHAAEVTEMPFVVLEGLRTEARQLELLKRGATRTLKSRHLTGHAVDLAPLIDLDGDGRLDVSWRWPHYRVLAPVIMRAAAECRVPVEWGGTWEKFPDGPHWQLPVNIYP